MAFCSCFQVKVTVQKRRQVKVQMYKVLLLLPQIQIAFWQLRTVAKWNNSFIQLAHGHYLIVFLLSVEPSYTEVESFRNSRTDEAASVLYPRNTFYSVTLKEIANSQLRGKKVQARYRRQHPLKPNPQNPNVIFEHFLTKIRQQRVLFATDQPRICPSAAKTILSWALLVTGVLWLPCDHNPIWKWSCRFSLHSEQMAP